jgi:type IX secretion system PorP/SprF family membrane protein
MNWKILQIKFLWIGMFLLLNNIGFSQDVHFSHLHSTPTFLNPGMTGLFNGNLRFVGNYKSQWNGFTNGYSTMAAAADMKLLETRGGSILGGGMSLYSDKAGDLDFSTSSATLNISFLQMLGRQGKSWIGVGFQNSMTQSRLDFNKIKTFEEEPLVMTGTRAYWHLGLGLAWTYEFGKKSSFHLGASLFHINAPNVSFTENRQYQEVFLEKKYVLHGGADIKLSKYFGIRPNFVFMDQGPHKEITLGTMIKYSRNTGLSRNDRNMAVYIGGWMRWYAELDLAGTDAFIAAMRVDWKNNSFTLSYDLNVSTLTPASYTNGGIELSVMKLLSWQKKAKNFKLKCPQDYF